MSTQHGQQPATRCVIYARTAAGGAHAVERQVAVLRSAIADRNGAKLVGEYRDVNVSGAGEAGPGLTALLGAVAAGGIDLVAVTGLGRFGRTAHRLGDTLAAIERGGARVLTVEAR